MEFIFWKFKNKVLSRSTVNSQRSLAFFGRRDISIFLIGFSDIWLIMTWPAQRFERDFLYCTAGIMWYIGQIYLYLFPLSVAHTGFLITFRLSKSVGNVNDSMYNIITHQTGYTTSYFSLAYFGDWWSINTMYNSQVFVQYVIDTNSIEIRKISKMSNQK